MISEFVTPVCLPFGDEENEAYQKSKDGPEHAIHVAGWGATNEKGIFWQKQIFHFKKIIYNKLYLYRKYISYFALLLHTNEDHENEESQTKTEYKFMRLWRLKHN